MRVRQTLRALSLIPWAIILVSFGLFAFRCQEEGIGDPCIPNDEFSDVYPGAVLSEVRIDDRSFSCESRVCLVHDFQGRVSCPYGNQKGGSNHEGEDVECRVPGANKVVVAAVPPQCASRRDHAPYCSCRCGGNDTAARYCDCPDGFVCGSPQSALTEGSDSGDRYCMRKSAPPDPSACSPQDRCDAPDNPCGLTSNRL